MAVTIDQLELDIQYRSSTAASGVDRLTTSLTSLRSATKGGAGLTTITKQISSLNAALTSISGLGKIAELVSGLNGLQGVGKATGFTSVMNQLKKLPLVIEGLEKADINKFNAQIQRLTTIMAPLATEMQKVSNGFSRLPVNIQRAINANTRLTTSNTRLIKSHGLLGTGISRIIPRVMMYTMYIKRVVNAIGEWINKSNEYQENLNLFRIAMGEYYDEALKYANTVQKTLGIDSSEWVRYQAVFQNMSEGFGIASDKALIMSKNLTQMGYDLASVFNTDFDTAMEKLESALSGQPRPMREWGFDLSEATLKSVALSKGITKNVENMTQMEKAQLRYIYLFENMQRLGLSGDFARTIEAPANALRVLSTNAEIAKRALGNMFIPVLNKILPIATAIVKVVRWVASEIASLAGFTMTDIDYSSLENASLGLDYVDESATAATEAVEELKKGLMGFDELNILPDPKSGSGNGTEGLGDGFNLDLPDDTGWLENAIGQKSDTLFEQYKAKIEPFVKWVKDNFEDIKDIIVAAGIALLGWKLGGELLNGIASIKALSTLGTIAIGVALLVAGITLEANGIVSALTDELNKINLAEIVGGALLLTGGGAAIGKVIAGAAGTAIGGGIAAIIAGVPAYFVGIWDAIKNGLNWMNGLLIPFGSTLAGAGIGAIIGSLGGPIGAAGGALIGLAIGAVTDIAIAVAEHWEAIKEKLIPDLSDISEKFDSTFGWIVDLIKNNFSAMREVWSVAFKNFKDIIGGVWSAIKSTFDKFSEITSTIKQIIEAVMGFIWSKVVDKINQIITFLTPIATLIKTKVIDPVRNFFVDLYTRITELFKNIAITISNAASDLIKKALNFAFGGIEGLVNGFIGRLNSVVAIINQIPGVNISYVSPFSIPRFARGGYPTPGQLFIANEAGPEMVGNLGGRTTVANNQDIAAGIEEAAFRGMARALATAQTGESNGNEITVELDGDKVGSFFVNYHNKKVRQTGATPLMV